MSFDYARMAENELGVIRQLEAGLERVRSEPAKGIDEVSQRHQRILLLEEELYEQKAVYRVLMQKAERMQEK